MSGNNNINTLKMHLFTHLLVQELSKISDVPTSQISQIFSAEVERMISQKTEAELEDLVEQLNIIHQTNN